MKTLLSIIAALALVVAFSMPAMAGHGLDIVGNDTLNSNYQSNVANDDSIAAGTINHNITLNRNRTYDDDNNALASAYLKQTIAVKNINDEVIDGHSGNICLSGSIDDFAGIANVNLNTGALNNQAIQNTIATSVSMTSGNILQGAQ